MGVHVCLASMIYLLAFSEIHCGTIPNKRDAFNPNRLMDYYMHFRTDQNQFGSYHPNDLVETIVEYFKHGGSQAVSRNQWGFSLYNPNNAIGQYMGEMHSPGTLGPEQASEPGQGSKKPSATQGTAFNPTVLNERLLQSAKAESGTSLDTVFAFDPDSVNRQLMADAKNHNPNAKFAPNESNGVASIATVGEFGKATGNSSAMATQGMQSVPSAYGFNPDQLNAGLYNGMNYDPNSVSSSMIGFGSGGSPFGNSGELSSKETSGSSASEVKETHSAQAPNGGDVTAKDGAGEVKFEPGRHSTGTMAGFAENTSGSSGGSVGMAGNNLFPSETESNTNSNAQDKTGSETHHTSHTNTASSAVENSPFPHQTSGNIQMTSHQTDIGRIGMNQASSAGILPTGGELRSGNSGGKTGSFTAGSLGPQNSPYGNGDAPPGVPSGGELQQTEAVLPVASGIGGMG